MRSIVFASLLIGAGSISSVAAEGINCEGNTYCNTAFNSKLPSHNDLIDQFYEALANGASNVVTGGPLIDYALYPTIQNKYIACHTSGVCLYLRGNYPQAGVNGSLIATRIGELNRHGCWYCGSVPLSGDNDPKKMGILTVNFVKGQVCDGVCK
ncbi:MAG: hypothetical protein LQ347_002545 [Umbilicaria vellea]|nr:MAG: hypothetical protein LQ347_002545 [Umbilicaria vellea]